MGFFFFFKLVRLENIFSQLKSYKELLAHELNQNCYSSCMPTVDVRDLELL